MKTQRLRSARVWAALAAGALIAGLVTVTSAGAVPQAQTVCGTNDPFNPELIEYTTISSDVVVDGYCILGPGVVVNGNVTGRRGSGLGIGQQAVVNGNVTLRGGNLYMGGPSDVPADPPATVTGTIEVVNAETGVFGIDGVFIGFGEVGGDLTLKNIPSVLLVAGCTDCGPGPVGPANIGGNLSIQNVRGGPTEVRGLFGDPPGYVVGGSVSLKNVDGPGQLVGNISAGDLSCKNVRDLDTWTVEANTVGGTDSCSG